MGLIGLGDLFAVLTGYLTELRCFRLAALALTQVFTLILSGLPSFFLHLCHLERALLVSIVCCGGQHVECTGRPAPLLAARLYNLRASFAQAEEILQVQFSVTTRTSASCLKRCVCRITFGPKLETTANSLKHSHYLVSLSLAFIYPVGAP